MSHRSQSHVVGAHPVPPSARREWNDVSAAGRSVAVDNVRRWVLEGTPLPHGALVVLEGLG